MEFPHEHRPQDYAGPHDYYGPDGRPEFRNMGHFADYIEGDILGNYAGDSLPILSTIGAGPQGPGVIAEPWFNQETGAWGFTLKNDETGEVFWTSPDMSPTYLEITQDKHKMVAGEPSLFHVHYLGEGTAKDRDLWVNPGADGSRIYVRQDIIEGFDPEDVRNHVQYISYSALMPKEYHDQIHHDTPLPRVDDVIFGFARNDVSTYMLIGQIEYSNLDRVANVDYDVVYVIHTAYEWKMPYINEDGNWVVNGYDTARPSRGEMGPQGEPGPMPDIRIDEKTGHWFINGEDTGQTYHGQDGFAWDLQHNYYVLGKDKLPDYDSVPFGYSFVVHDIDPELHVPRYDLYYKGRYPIAAEDGGPWRVVEDWQGRPGASMRILKKPKTISKDIGSTTEISLEEAASVFSPARNLANDDIVMDEEGTLALLSGVEPEPTGYTLTTVGMIHNIVPTINGVPIAGEVDFADLHASYNDLINKPAINGHEISQETVGAELQFDYEDLVNKPKINGIEVSQDKQFGDFAPSYDQLEMKPAINGTQLSAETNFSELNASYQDLQNLPTLNEVPLTGAMTYDELGIASQDWCAQTIDERLASVYRAAGSCLFEELPPLGEATPGAVYNIENDFVTTDDFLEGSGHQVKAGYNVVCVQDEELGLKWDVLSSLVDLSNYPTKREMTEAINSSGSIHYTNDADDVLHGDGTWSHIQGVYVCSEEELSEDGSPLIEAPKADLIYMVEKGKMTQDGSTLSSYDHYIRANNAWEYLGGPGLVSRLIARITELEIKIASYESAFTEENGVKVLKIENGGTGKTTGEEALANLGLVELTNTEIDSFFTN